MKKTPKRSHTRTVLPHNREFIARLRQLVAIVGSASALAKKAEISQSGFQRYLGGGDPTRKVLVQLANAANVNLHWLATGEGSHSGEVPATVPGIDSKASLTRLPLYKVEASSASSIVALHDGRTTLPGLAFCRNWLGKQGLESKQLAGLLARGNSMEPTIRNGESLLVDLGQREIMDGEIYVMRDGSNFLIKRLQRKLEGKLRMLSDNKMYPVIECAESAVEVLGKVVWRGSLL